MEKEMRLIDANALKAHINGVSTHWLNDWSTLGVLAAVDKQPTVDAVEVVHGRWEKHTVAGEDFLGTPVLKIWACNCSVCRLNGKEETPYCPNCGAKMDGDGNG